MPVDVVHDLDTAWGFLRHLADIVESKKPHEVDMNYYHCGTAHCAWGWAEVTPKLRVKMPYSANDRLDNPWSSRKCDEWCRMSGLTRNELRYCFGGGIQFDYLDRPYTPADVARHLREVADAVQERSR